MAIAIRQRSGMVQNVTAELRQVSLGDVVCRE
jgi:hypothetical protein